MDAKTKKVFFSGIQPTGNLHLGNYLGAIQQWVGLQNQKSKIKNQNDILKLKKNSNELNPTTDNKLPIANGVEFFFCVVDLHAITIYQDPKILRAKTRELTALYLACGIDKDKSHIFVQSQNPDHTYLSWILDCFIPMGWMERMTQYKDKKGKQQDRTSMGLFNYPALMAADILLYDTTHVPVGDDQVQHIELTRDIAKRMNSLYGNMFIVPTVVLDMNTARIMSLSNPLRKMSKSDTDPTGTINLLDPPDDIVKKITRAVTDSGSEIVYSPKDKPAISNLLTIYSKCTDKKVDIIVNEYSSKGYSDLKKDLAENVVGFLHPIQEKYNEIIKDRSVLEAILAEGKQHAVSKSSMKISIVKNAVGLGI